MRLSPRVKRIAAIFSLDSLHPNGCAERTKKTKAAHQSIKGIQRLLLQQKTHSNSYRIAFRTGSLNNIFNNFHGLRDWIRCANEKNATDSTDWILEHMGGPPASSDGLSSRRERSSLLELKPSLGQRAALPPMC
jgi:hypothetical protein